MRSVNRCAARLCLLWTAFAAFGLASARAADSEWLSRVWQSDDGLPDNSVAGVVQTSDGYLWVATQSGLVRFDGIGFKRVLLPIISGMPMEMIRAMMVGEGDCLWMALEGGVAVAAAPHETKVFTSQDGLSVSRPCSIVQDAAGSVWIGYSDGSACGIEGGHIKRFEAEDGVPGLGSCWLATDARKQLWFTKAGRVGRYQEGRFVSLVSTAERSVCIAGRRRAGLWVCAGRNLYSYDEGGDLLKVASITREAQSIEPLAMCEDHTGAVWIGTGASGLFCFDGTNMVQIEAPRVEVRSITEDREGNIWVGSSGGGLTRWRPRAVRFYSVRHGLPFETVRSVCEDSGGFLWVVAQNGSLARGRGEAWSVLNLETNWPGGQASCVTADSRGTVWIGTADRGLYRWADGAYRVLRKADGLSGGRVWAVMTDAADDLWVSFIGPNCVERLRGGKFTQFDLPAGSHVIRAMTEDASHVVWLGSEDGRLFRVRDETLVEQTQQTLARPVAIRCLEATSDGSVWIGYAGAGLGRLKDGRFVRLGTEQGLPDEFISQIVADGRGSLWFAVNSGIFQVPQRELEAAAEGRLSRVRPVFFGRNEGLISLQANFGYGPSSARTRDGRLCFSMLTGLVVISPAKVAFNPVPPLVTIEQLSVDGRDFPRPAASQLLGGQIGAGTVPVAARLEIPPQHRELKLGFNALSFVSPENVRLRYQLIGYDQHEIETTQRSVTYSRMPAGAYRFRVTACNESGVWNPAGAVLDFAVLPFFWETWWFRPGVALVFTGLVIGIVRYISFRRLRRTLLRLEQEAALQKDRARIAKDLHDDLGAHLSQIAMLSELAQSDLDKPAQARSHIDQIFRNARLLTRSLDEIVWAVNPGNDSLDRFAAHVCQFAPEYLRAAGIRPRLDMPIDLPPVKLSAHVRHQLYLGFKEALHNIVKHAGATEVWVRLSVTNGTVTLAVEDNGRGFAGGAASVAGDGLQNLRQRMEEIGGRFEQQSEPQHGTRVTFIAPMQGKPE